MTRLEQLVRGYQFTQALYVAVDLSIPDLVADGPQDVATLAASCGAHRASLARLLRALTSVGVFVEVEPCVFGPTSLSDALREGVEDSLRAWLVLNAVDLYQTWGELGHSVRTGETATSRVYGMDSWTWRSLHPEQGTRFDAAMSERSRRRVEAFVASYDMTPFGTVVDVGGGQGALLQGILDGYPTVRGVLYDLPHVVAGVADRLGSNAVSGRIDVVPGDFLVEVPEGGDAYVLSLVLHDWDDAQASAILARCRDAMADRGVVLLYERVLPAGPDLPWEPMFSDLNMLVAPGGRERTRDQFAALLERAGFRHTRLVPAGEFNYVEAVPV